MAVPMILSMLVQALYNVVDSIYVSRISEDAVIFICHDDATFLDGQYAGFGAVVEGIETVDKIASVRTDFRDKPYEDQVMKQVYFVK